MAPGTKATGTHATGNSNQKLVTNVPAKATIVAVEPDVMLKVDKLHQDFLDERNTYVKQATNPDWAAKSYIDQWIKVLKEKNSDPYYYPTTDVYSVTYYNDEIGFNQQRANMNRAVRALCRQMWTRDYVAAVTAMGPQGFAKYAEHVQGMNETDDGRQWLHMQEMASGLDPNFVLPSNLVINSDGTVSTDATTPPDPDAPNTDPRAAGSDPNAAFEINPDDAPNPFPDELYDPSLDCWNFLKDRTKTTAWLKQIAPRDQTKKEVDPEGPEGPEWMELNENLIDQSFFSTFAEYHAVMAAIQKDAAYDTAIKLIVPRMGFPADELTSDQAEFLRDLFKKHNLLKSTKVTVGQTIAEKDVTEDIELLEEKEENWTGMGERAEGVAKVLVVINFATTVKKFAADPNIKNGIGLASAMLSITGAFRETLEKWVRPGRVASADDAATRVVLKAAEEETLNAAAEEGAIDFIAKKTALESADKFLVVLGVFQGALDAVSAFWDMGSDIGEGNVEGAMASGIKGVGGLLIMIGSLVCLSGAGLALGAALVVIGTFAELLGSILGAFFPDPTDFQKWVRRTIFGFAPEGTLAEQVGALNLLVYKPTVTVTQPDDNVNSINIDVKIPGLDAKGSRILLFTLAVKQGDSAPSYIYAPLHEDTAYANNPAVIFNYGEGTSLKSVSFTAALPQGKQYDVTGTISASIDPQSDGHPFMISGDGKLDFIQADVVNVID